MGSLSDRVISAANGIGVKVADSDYAEFETLLERMDSALKMVAEMDDYQPTPDYEVIPRKDIHLQPKEENPLSAWAWRFTAASSKPSSDLLKGRTLCLKDNICVAGVPCLLGTETIQGWVPQTDATIVPRILDAGGIITGKAVCENLSRGAVSVTAASGPVSNPYAKGYSAGGSSSGTGALVGSGAVDMGIGCDQGGSIRIPAGLCGLYGFKATIGLVPYTGIVSNDASLDYVGPMTTTCMDNALLLEAIAGVDGLDDRQAAGTPFPNEVPHYAKLLEETKEQGVRGMKIGILKEGVDQPLTNPDVKEKFMAALAEFEKLGATVEEFSIPMHNQGRTIYSVMSKMGNHMGMLGRAVGRKQMLLTDLLEKKNAPYTQAVFDKMSVMTKEGLLSGEYAWQRYPTVYAKSVNLCRKLKEEYDAALAKYDLLVMPTTITASSPLPPVTGSPLVHIDASKGKLENTCSFNATGHPCLSMPIGLVPAPEDASIKLPASMQIVGKYWDEPKIFQAAYAWEQSVGKWQNF
ncbi:putative amidase [Rhizodiscina lignyota]|uniref:Amidase n=1 Tax=Rhizodiscina lignyota TaxID=1504668 RepID=A0A9P4INV7_9PEZI|nr:putative amidase [Rhizodiscina lignyota]